MQLIAVSKSLDEEVRWATDNDRPTWTAGAVLLVTEGKFSPWRTQALALLANQLGSNHLYVSSFEAATRQNLEYSRTAGAGILEAVLDDLNDGYLNSVIEEAHLDVLTDFLDMADYLLADRQLNLKDPAAVLIGGVIEGHLIKLCEKNAIAIKMPNGDRKRAQRLCDDLGNAGEISKNDQKNVTAWLATRNSAAHTNYDDYSKDQITLLSMQVRDFVARYPA